MRQLRPAWTYRTGESGGAPAYAHIAFEATPLMIDGTLFFSTPYNRVIALDAETGAERWVYEPKVDRTRRLAIVTSRGVSTWLDPAAAPGRPCRRRIYRRYDRRAAHRRSMPPAERRARASAGPVKSI